MDSATISLNQARDRMVQRDRIRELRMQRHLLLALFAGLALAVLLPAADTVLELAFVPVLVGVVVRSIARGADARYGHMWGWVYFEPKAPTRLDHMAGRLIDFARPPQRDRASQQLKVRPLDPFG